MKKALLLLAVALFAVSFASAQMLFNFNSNVNGVEKSGDSGKGLDSLYKAADPSNSANGVMAMHITFGSPNDTVNNLHARFDIGSAGNATNVVPGDAQIIVFWVYLDTNQTQKIPDSLQIDTYGMDNTNWTWTEGALEKHYAKDIPKNVWYPLAFQMATNKAKNPNFAYNASGAGKGFQTGLQLQPNNTKWTGVIYVDNIALYGSWLAQDKLQTFDNNISGVEKSGDSGKGLDSLYKAADPLSSANGVMAMHITFGPPNDTVSNLHARFDLGSAGSAATVVPGAANFLTTWIYLDTAQHVPDSLQIDVYGMDNTNWSWTEGASEQHYAKDIPKGVWYPLTFEMAANKAKNPNFAYNSSAAGKGFQTGLQFQPHNTKWTGVIYVDNIFLQDTILSLPAVWTAANFESNTQGFYIPAYGATGTLSRVADLTTSNGSWVLQGAVDLSTGPRKFAVAHAKVPMQTAAGDSVATSMSIDVYLPNKMPAGGTIKFFVSGGINDSIAVVDTFKTTNKWVTETIAKLDSLKTAGKFDPTKPATIGVLVSYPQDTSTWKGNLWFDNLIINGEWWAANLSTKVEQTSNVARTYQLYQNYPNPFNPTTVIQYDVPKQTQVALKVYDILGRIVATLVDEKQVAGSYKVTFDASRFASGVYFVRMVAGSYTKSQKILLMK